MFKKRSYTKELLDEPDIAKDLLYRNLKELEIINRYLGGHNISLKGLAMVIGNNTQSYKVVDIGCGGGDSIHAIAEWGKKAGNIHLEGIDLKQDCINYAANNCAGLPRIYFRCCDFKDIFSEVEKPDIIHASLFFHHFKEEDISEFLALCSANKATVIINDLERNPIAYYSIKWLTKLFSRSPLVKNDAPLSVLRGFRMEEWVSIMQKAGIKNYSIKNCWAFRHLVITYPNE